MATVSDKRIALMRNACCSMRAGACMPAALQTHASRMSYPQTTEQELIQVQSCIHTHGVGRLIGSNRSWVLQRIIMPALLTKLIFGITGKRCVSFFDPNFNTLTKHTTCKRKRHWASTGQLCSTNIMTSTKLAARSQ